MMSARNSCTWRLAHPIDERQESDRSEGVQDAYQTGAIIVLPILMLVVGQATA